MASPAADSAFAALWDNPGAISVRLESGLAAGQELVHYLNRRAKAESEMGSLLLKSVTGSLTAVKGTRSDRVADTSAMMDVWKTLFAQTEAASAVHEVAAEHLQHEVTRPLEHGLKGVETSLHRLLRELESALKRVRGNSRHHVKARAHYLKLGRDLDTMAQTGRNSTRSRFAEVLFEKSLASKRRAFREAEAAYTATHREVQTPEAVAHRGELSTILRDLEQLEATRVALVCDALAKLTALTRSSIVPTHTALCLAVDASAANVDLPADAKAFCASVATGEPLGGLMPFELYTPIEAIPDDDADASPAKEAAEASGPALFGCSLTEYMHAQRQAEGAVGSLAVPLPFLFLIDRVIALGGLSAEGLFRVPGDTVTIKLIKSHIEETITHGLPNLAALTEPGLHDTSDEYGLHAWASCLKLWLRELAEPIVNDECYDFALHVAETQDDASLTAILQSLLAALPETHRDVLQMLVAFLRRLDPATTMMTHENLGVCFAPSLFRCEDLMKALANVLVEKKVTELIVGKCAGADDARLARELNSARSVWGGAPEETAAGADADAAAAAASAAAEAAGVAEGPLPPLPDIPPLAEPAAVAPAAAAAPAADRTSMRAPRPETTWMEWQWQTDKGHWQRYDKDTAKMLQTAKDSGMHELFLPAAAALGGHSYTANLEAMEQVNTTTGKRRALRVITRHHASHGSHIDPSKAAAEQLPLPPPPAHAESLPPSGGSGAVVAARGLIIGLAPRVYAKGEQMAQDVEGSPIAEVAMLAEVKAPEDPIRVLVHGTGSFLPDLPLFLVSDGSSLGVPTKVMVSK